MAKIRRSQMSYDEFSKLPKVKQIFTPWFITALLVFIVLGGIAFAMIALASEGFENARSFVDGHGHFVNDDSSKTTLMAWLEYDPHSNYQELYKELAKYSNDELTEYYRLYKTEQFNELGGLKVVDSFKAFEHSHANGNINHNSTWGFATKVLGAGSESWFYKFIQEFERINGSFTHAGHEVKLAEVANERLAVINANVNTNYQAYYWVFIICMMPQMIATVIIVVKLITVLSPKKNAEEKAAYKLAKQQQKATKAQARVAH